MHVFKMSKECLLSMCNVLSLFSYPSLNGKVARSAGQQPTPLKT